LTSREKGFEEFYLAVEAIKERCLRDLDSLFAPGRAIWSRGSANELYRRFVGNPDESKLDFVQKLQGQLEGASGDVVQLAAEVLYVLLLGPDYKNPAIKRESIKTILNVSPEPVPLPDDLSEALAHGIASYGAALSQRQPQYIFLLEFARSWVELETERREALLSDADQFYEFLLSLPQKAASSQVAALLHIVFPDSFEPIVSVGVKQKIVNTFSEYGGDETLPIDKRIALIRQELSREYGDAFGFYDQAVRERWDIAKDKLRPRRAWLIRGANDNQINRIPDWLSNGYISIGWEEGLDLRPGMSRHEIDKQIARTLPDLSQRIKGRAVGNMDRFLNLMEKDDIIMTVDDVNAYFGIASGEAEQLGTVEDGALWQRHVVWINPDAPIERESLPGELRFSLKTMMTLTDVSKHMKMLEALVEGAKADNWDTFLLWAERLYKDESFDRQERDYKLAATLTLSEARAAFVAGKEWLPFVRQAFSGENNLVNWRTRDTFITWCEEQPELASDAIGALWEGDEVTEEAVDLFASGVGPDTAPGNRVNIASVLLMGVDATRWPPFRPTVDERARKLLGISDRAKSFKVEDGKTYRPNELAEMLGVSGLTVRNFLRAHFPRPAEDKSADWHLNADIARAIVNHVCPSATTASAGGRYFAFLELVDELLERLLVRGVEVRDRLDAQSLLWWVTSGQPPEDWSEEDQAAFLAYQRGEEAIVSTKASSMVEPELIPPATDELARSVYLPRAWLQEAVDLLHEKRQVIFYGPPGTGKTFVAQALGEHLRAAGGDWQLVQFHPAYSYEDFFEGYRPSQPEDDGALQFDLQRGPLRLLAEQAASNPDTPYLLVIDEINRGNIAKIFGELYFLLEYRDRPIRLQYSPDQSFELPENLFLIGTMNTADRSIALVDSALRRRFYFYPFVPLESPVRDVLGAWLEENGYEDEPARLLDTLNAALHEALPDDDFAFGPSYFMPRDGPPDLERVWRYAIHPLLEERFYGARQSAELEQDFGLAAMRARLLKADVVAEASEEEDEEVGGTT
jgi:hypothetical protein